ncbi:MAG: stage VI sporulation protein F [Coprobacillaceae bacterium]
MRDKMKDKDKLLKRVVDKTNVSKEDIFSLANDLQTKDLKKDEDIRDFIGQIAKVTNKSLNEAKMDKLVDIIKNNKIPKDIDKMV